MTTDSDSNPSQPAAPTDSANPTPAPEASSAPVEASGSTENAMPTTDGESAPSQESGPTSSQAGDSPPDPGKKKKSSGKQRRPPAPKYSLKAREKTYQKRKDEVRGITDSIIQSELADVEEAFVRASKAGTTVSSASDTFESAETAWLTQRAPLYLALSRVAALLNLTKAGKELYKACRATTKMGWAENIANRLPPGDLGLPSALTADLRAQVTHAKPYAQAYDVALQRKRTAAASFTTARGQLDGHLEALYGSYLRYVGAKKAGKVDASAPSQPANGTAVKPTAPVKNGVKNGAHRGA